MNCKEFGESLSLYLYEELGAEQRAACDAHLASCSGCRAALEETRRLHHVLSQRAVPEPSPQLLAECRQALNEALDREPETAGWQGLLQGWFLALNPSPAFRAAGALAFLMFGFSLGWTLRPRAAPIQPSSRGIASASLAGTDLENMRISGISRVAPDPRTGEVRVTLDAERRVTLEGSLDNPRIQQVLVYAVKSYDNPGIRRDSLDALRAGGNNPNVRQALLYEMSQDSNLGVRLAALDAARTLEWGPDARRSFLAVLEHEKNPGLRVAAIDVLAQHANEDEQLLSTLERLAATDSNRSVRLKCASAIREGEGR